MWKLCLMSGVFCWFVFCFRFCVFLQRTQHLVDKYSQLSLVNSSFLRVFRRLIFSLAPSSHLLVLLVTCSGCTLFHRLLFILIKFPSLQFWSFVNQFQISCWPRAVSKFLHYSLQDYRVQDFPVPWISTQFRHMLTIFFLFN